MKNIIKGIFIFIVLGIAFVLLCSGTEWIIVMKLHGNVNFFNILNENFISEIIAYVIICICLFLVILIHNYFIVKKLNKELEKMKTKGGE